MSRTVKLTLEANVSGLVSGLKTAQKATSDFTRDLGSWRQKNEAHLDTLGSAAGKAGLGIVAGLGLMGKAAMDWESSWTGVLKTVDGTPEQLGKVEDGLRGLAKILPSSHAEIAGVAEAAGQLGVATDDVVDFTKVMIDLGQSTNLSAEEAATSLARFSNVMGTSNKDVDRLGATLVGLGNNYATTESEIMGMSMRLSGASRQIGLSEGQTMGLAAAMSSVGIEAEAGGSAMSLTMKRVGKAVDEGGQSLDLFSKTSGMTSADFQAAWKEDAAGALEAFVLGLGKAGEDGESVNAILTELGITGIRESDALLRLSSAGELMGSSMKQGATEYADGSALIEEATKRYETAESKVKMAWNNIKDAAITAGGVMLPVIASLAEGAASIADWFGKIPVPIQNFLTVLAGVSGVGLLAVSGLINISKKTSELSTAFASIYGTGGRAHTAINKVSKALSGAVVVGAALLAGKAILEGINEAARSGYPDLQEYFNLLSTGGGKDVADALDFGRDRGAGKNKALEGLKEQMGTISVEAAVAKKAVEQVGNVNWFEKNLLKDAPGIVGETIENALKLETALGGVARAFDMGEIATAQQGFADMATQLDFTDAEVGKLINGVPELKSALMDLATSEGIKVDPNDELGLVDLALGRISVSAPDAAGAIEGVGGAAGSLGGSMGTAIPVTEDMAEGLAEIGVSADGTITAIDKLMAALWQLSDGTLSVRAANRDVEDSFRTMKEAIKENGKSLDESTAKGSANQANLDGYILSLRGRTDAIATAVDENGNLVHSDQEVQDSMTKSYDQAIKAAGEFGIFGDKAKGLARDLLGIPEDVSIKTWLDDFATDRANQITGALDAMPERKDIKVMVTDDGTANLTQAQIDAILGQTAFVEVTDEGTVLHTQGKIDGVTNGDAQILVSDDGTITVVQGGINGINDGAAKVNVTDGGTINSVQQGIYNLKGGSVTVKVGYNDPGTPIGFSSLIPKRATGGSVFGAGTETSDSIPAWLSNNEHVLSAKEVRGLGGHSAVERLRAMARGGDAPRFKTGGAVGRAESKVKSTRRAYDLIDGKRANRLRKLAAKDQWEAAKAELAAVKKSSKASADAAKKAKEAAKKAAQEAREKAARLNEGRFDLRTEARRGTMLDSFTSGGGMGIVDRMFEASNNKDLSKKQRANMRTLAYKTEKELLRLEKQAESAGKALEKATSKRDELLGVRDGVASGLKGGFGLQSLMDDQQRNGFSKVTSKSLLASGKARAGEFKAFTAKLEKLRKMGFGTAVLDEIQGYGIDEGTVLADVLLGSTKTEVKAFNNVYKDVSKHANAAGDVLANSMFKGGVNAAESLVKAAKSKEAAVDKAFYNLGKAGQKGFHRAWGIASPAKEAKKDMGWIVAGHMNELERLKPSFAAAMEGLYASPKYSVPPASVAYGAAQPAHTTVENHYHIDAKPGLAHQYAMDVAVQTSTRVGDLLSAHGMS